ncbi:sigma factor-like helix-turn-helix DNA-binding protein [Pseudomonas sp. UBA4194]|uniref:sigma factor-like helix-turn-helix DNA-binding protein n=1 Tax=Pseudomonas sp. UBA4194 TaxID=1947317 RepID=UPI0025F50A72|nr:sigma factor-like helix-turn-helix DNA-binding protein [Pseudomonas sp. UBA4194]
MTQLLTQSHNLFDNTPGQQGQDSLFLSLKKLPRRAQQVLLFSRLDNLPYPAIAQRLDISLSCVEKDMHAALEACFPPRTAANSLAMGWYARLQNPATTASERIDFRRWLDSASEHVSAFHDTELRWRQLLAPARVLGVGHWYRKSRLGLRAWLTAGLAVALTLEFISQTL